MMIHIHVYLKISCLYYGNQNLDEHKQLIDVCFTGKLLWNEEQNILIPYLKNNCYPRCKFKLSPYLYVNAMKDFLDEIN